MNFIDNEYLVPVFIGNSRVNLNMAKRIRKQLGIKGHAFAPSYNLFERLAFHCHKVSPMADELLVLSLQAFYDQLEDYFCPVIVICDERAGAVIARIRQEIEYAYIVTNGDALLGGRC